MFLSIKTQKKAPVGTFVVTFIFAGIFSRFSKRPKALPFLARHENGERSISIFKAVSVQSVKSTCIAILADK